MRKRIKFDYPVESIREFLFRNLEQIRIPIYQTYQSDIVAMGIFALIAIYGTLIICFVAALKRWIDN
jgi:hypothetical protein